MLVKTFNSILNNRLHTYSDNNKIVNPCQIGFQSKSRTVDHMFILRTLIEKYTNNKPKFNICFVDFQKPFDYVLHSALLNSNKRKKMDIKCPIYNIIQNMYLD